MALDRVGGQRQVVLRHQVGVDVVVGDRAVLVGAGDAVDAKAPLGVVVAERAPQSRGLDEQFESDLAFERLVVGCGLVAADRVGDVGGDVKGGRPGWPVAGAFLAGDRAPGKDRACKSEQPRSLAGEPKRCVAPTQRVARGIGDGVRQDRQDERLAVPERVPVVARARQALCWDRAALASGARLERVEEREAHRLLELGVAFQLDVGALPEIVQVVALAGTRPSQPVSRAPASAAATWSRRAGVDRWLDQPYAKNLITRRRWPGSTRP